MVYKLHTIWLRIYVVFIGVKKVHRFFEMVHMLQLFYAKQG